ncbi:MAG: PIN domain-containing protein [Bifidobacteriaceae bacterium]|nr:PIN domain-containing protein [Bifidobacteriaceae bacterium]
MVIVDTSALLAYLDAAEPDHQAVKAALSACDGDFVVSELVLAELDYLILSRYGVREERAALAALAHRRWRVSALGADGLAQATALIDRHANEAIGLTDAANLVLAARFKTRRVATLDHRHFGHLTLPDGSAVEIVP